MNGSDAGVCQQIQVNERKSLRDEPGPPRKTNTLGPTNAINGSHEYSRIHFFIDNHMK